MVGRQQDDLFPDGRKSRAPHLFDCRDRREARRKRFLRTAQYQISTSAATAARWRSRAARQRCPPKCSSRIPTAPKSGRSRTRTAALLAQLDLPGAEPFWFEGAEKTQVEGLLLRPPHFDASKKYPLLLADSRRAAGRMGRRVGLSLESQLMASPGYVVLMINPRGSFGYGHKFTRRDQPRLGRKSLRRSDEGRGRGAREVSVHRRLTHGARREAPTAVTWSTGSPRTPAGSNA